MPLSWFDLTEVRTFAGRLVDDLHRTRAAGAARADKSSQIVKRMDKLVGQAADFETSRRLNIYKKAQFLFLVRRGLTEKGWARAETDVIVEQLMTTRLRRPPQQY